MQKKRLTLAAGTAALAAAMSMTAFAAGRQKNDRGWWYGTNADNSRRLAVGGRKMVL
ncbi:MAG: hypothetical protein HFE83_03920 [Lachnospiraceae bacterium]|nr:hypothetical protein [Lachnospiraceae bacterium]